MSYQHRRRHAIAVGAIASAALLVAGSVALAQGSAADRFQRFREARTIVYDDDGEPLFAGNAAFVAKVSSNPQHIVFDVDRRRGYARITAPASPGLWVQCDAISPKPKQCAGVHVRQIREGASRGGSLPQCPGDVRCPR